MLMCLRILFFNCAFFLAALAGLAGQQLAAEVVENDLMDGIALVTSRQGDATLITSNAKTRSPELHAVETLSGVEVTSGKDDSIFLSLSNGMGLGVYEDSHLRFESYLQRPFPSERESLEYEPTLSKLVVELFEGSLSFSAEHISPLSEIVIKLPKGQIQIQRASGRVLYDENGAHISIIRGIVSYDYPHGEEPAFIHGGNRVRISDGSAMRGRLAESNRIPSGPYSQLTERLVEATRHASERVVYRVDSEGASIPQPILVAKPETLQQPSPRPYRYLD